MTSASTTKPRKAPSSPKPDAAGAADTNVADTNVALATSIVEELTRSADPERAAGQQGYMKRALPFLGLRVPAVRSLTHAACKRHPCTSEAQFRATASQLFASAKYQEHRYAAVSICTFRGHRQFQSPNAFETYREMIVTAEWWDITDELSHLFGALLLSHPGATKALLRKWAHDENIWLRRVSIIAQLGLAAKVDLPLLFDNIEPSLQSSEFFLRKAIGWALRDVAKTNPEATRSYVTENDGRLSPLSKREALKNL
jgi:3-methyladenine DNA glycosylase AlkD